MRTTRTNVWWYGVKRWQASLQVSRFKGTPFQLRTHRTWLGEGEPFHCDQISLNIPWDKRHTWKTQDLDWFLPREQYCLEKCGCIFTIRRVGSISDRTSRCFSKSYHIPTWVETLNQQQSQKHASCQTMNTHCCQYHTGWSKHKCRQLLPFCIDILPDSYIKDQNTAQCNQGHVCSVKKWTGD